MPYNVLVKMPEYKVARICERASFDCARELVTFIEKEQPGELNGVIVMVDYGSRA